MDEMILFVGSFVHLFVCIYKTCKVMDSDFNFFLFSHIFFHLFRYRLLTRFVCHTNTAYTFPVNKTKSVLISVNLKKKLLIYQVQQRICIDFFSSILLCFSSLSHTSLSHTLTALLIERTYCIWTDTLFCLLSNMNVFGHEFLWVFSVDRLLA